MASVRPARPEDASALSRVCLLTANAGSSAEELHAFPDLPGFIYALPYNKLDTTFGFVLVDDNVSVVGYIVGTTDTFKFAEIADQEWWPPLRVRYPIDDDPSRTPADTQYISRIYSPYICPKAVAINFPAHVHINILPSHQRKSYGKTLMSAAVNYLRERGHSGLHVGLNPSNESAKLFYSRIGFKRIDITDGEWWGLTLSDFRA